MKPPSKGHSRTAPETSRNALSTIQGTNEDDSQSDLHPEAGIFHNQMTQNYGPEDGHEMVTGVDEEVTYCALSTFSRKQKKTALPVCSVRSFFFFFSVKNCQLCFSKINDRNGLGQGQEWVRTKGFLRCRFKVRVSVVPNVFPIYTQHFLIPEISQTLKSSFTKFFGTVRQKNSNEY